MKKVLFICMICLTTMSISAQNYVDLGLPSGTLWKESNEGGYYAYEQAVSKFDGTLPTKKQFEELMDNCRWVWNGNGYKVVGPSGKLIILPAEGYLDDGGRLNKVGYLGLYWSSISSDSDYSWRLYFNSGGMVLDEYFRSFKLSVRLVK